MIWAAALSALGQAASAPDTGSAIATATGSPISWNQNGEWNSATGSAKVTSTKGLPSWVYVALAGIAAVYLLKKGK